jgi:uncharacterized protein YjbI with pentapeptide repeats
MSLSMREILRSKLGLLPPYTFRELFPDGCADIILNDWLENLAKQDSVTRRFIPHLHGFRFTNSGFEFTVGADHYAGACGGMCYTALDYFLADNKTIPDDDQVPEKVSWLYKYISGQQHYSINGVWPKASEFLLNPDINKVSNTRNGNLPGGNIYSEVKARILAQPCVLILIPHAYLNFGEWHQVLAVACTHDMVPDRGLIHIYDPNNPGKEYVLRVSGNKVKQHELDCYGDYDPNVTTAEWDAYLINKHYTYTEPLTESIVNLENQDCRSWHPDQSRRTKYVNSKLSGADFSGNHNLNDLDFAGSEAVDTIFADVGAERCNFSKCQLDSADFSQADLKGSYFSDAEGDAINFSSAWLQEIVLTDGKFNSSVYENAEIKGADYRMAHLNNSSWKNAKITSSGAIETSYEHARLNSAVFDGSIISKTTFKGCALENAVFCSAILEDVLFQGSATAVDTCSGITFREGTEIKMTIFNQLKIPGGSFLGVSISNSSFKNITDGVDLDFTGSTMHTVEIDGCDWLRPRFQQAVLFNVNFSDVKLTSPDFSGAVLQNSLLNTDKIEGAVFDNAVIVYVEIQGMTVNEFNSCSWDGTTINHVICDNPDVQALFDSL